MIDNGLLALALTGLGVAALHAALPTHWLPFVLIGQRRKWSYPKILSVAALAGAGHVLSTALLGAAAMLAGFMIGPGMGAVLPWLGSGLLVLLGTAMLAGVGHRHSSMDETQAAVVGDWPLIAGLVLMLTLSPCEAFLPVYLSGFEHGWTGFGLLSLALAAGTAASMAALTGLALTGRQSRWLSSLSRNEPRVLGILLICLGVAMAVLEIYHN